MGRVILILLLGLPVVACGSDEEATKPTEETTTPGTEEPTTPESGLPDTTGPAPGPVDPFVEIQRGIGSADEEERLIAVSKLGDVDKPQRSRAVEMLLPRLSDESSDVRQVAAQMYAKLQAEDLTPLRQRIEVETDGLVQRALVEALFQCGGEDAIIDLRGCAADVMLEESVRCYAIDALGRLKATASRDILEEAAEDISVAVRRAAVTALGRIGHEGSIRILGDRMGDNDVTVLVEAARALKTIGGRQVVRHLCAGLESDDPDVLRVVNAALVEITGEKMGYEPEGDYTKNQAAIEKWRAWWEKNQKHYQ